VSLRCFSLYFFIIGVQIFTQWALHHESVSYVSLRHNLAFENFRNQCSHAVRTGRYCSLCIIPEHALSLCEVQISERIERHISPTKRPNWRFYFTYFTVYSTFVEYQPHRSLTMSLPDTKACRVQPSCVVVISVFSLRTVEYYLTWMACST